MDATDRTTTETRAALDSMRRIVRFLRRSASTTSASLGVTSAQLFVLQTLVTQKQLTINELADRTYTDQSTVSVVAKGLEERGLVARARSTRDARRVHVSLTREGHALLARAAGTAVSARLVEAMQALSAPRRRNLVTSLADLVRALGLEDEPAAMLFEEAIGPRRPGEPRRAE